MTLKEIHENFTLGYAIAVTSTLTALSHDAEGVADNVRELSADLIEALEVFDSLEFLNEDNVGSVDAFIAVSGLECEDVSEVQALLEAYESAFIGGQTLLEYAVQYVEDTGALEGVPDTLAQYFDYEAYARDMRVSGEIVEEDGWLFNTNW
jgi:antirestriction protein